MAGDITIANVIKDNAGGASAVTITGLSGRIVKFSGANPYTGSTTINGGRLIIDMIQAATAPGDVIINNGGEVKMSGNKFFATGVNVAVNAGGKWYLDGSSQTVGRLTGSGTITETYVLSGAARNSGFRERIEPV